MSVVAVVSQKGGVSKSCLCIHLAVEAARKKVPTLVLELDPQGTTSLFWAERRAEKAKQPRPANPFGDDEPLQPEVRRADPSTLVPTLEQVRADGTQLVLLDLPGANNPAVTMAMAASDYILIPTRPNDVDLHASLETAGAARRLQKPAAYVLTFVPSTGTDAQRMRDRLEGHGYVVAPSGLGDRRKDYAEAMADGVGIQEIRPDGASAQEVRTIYNWLRQQLEKVHGKQAA
jgi:chromosome partitioning protein